MLFVEIDRDKIGVGLAKLEGALNPEEILDEAAAMLLNRIRTRFLAEQDTNENPWPQSKAAAKRRASGGTGTLFDTGRLFHSIQAAATGPNEREIGTDVPYAPFHQYGTKKLPVREFLGASQKDIDLIDKLIVRRVRKAFA